MNKIKTIGNYIHQTSFPLDEETLLSLQDNQTLLELLGNIAGDKIVLTGCELENANTSRKEGYVFLRTADYPDGEILYYAGGSVSAGLCLQTTSIDISSNQVSYTGAYTKRQLISGRGTENFDWEDFTPLSNTKDLASEYENIKKKVELISPAPLGTIQIWCGKNIPEPEIDGYCQCDGRKLSKKIYQDLYTAIGDQYNEAHNWADVAQTTEEGYFRIPDLRSRFIVGKNDPENDSDYSKTGTTGGEKKHTLTVEEMPRHAHQVAGTKNSTNWKSGGAYSSNDATVNFSKMQDSTFTGNNQPHENRPPFYVLSYIMRVK